MIAGIGVLGRFRGLDMLLSLERWALRVTGILVLLLVAGFIIFDWHAFNTHTLVWLGGTVRASRSLLRNHSWADRNRRLGDALDCGRQCFARSRGHRHPVSGFEQLSIPAGFSERLKMKDRKCKFPS